VPCLANCQVGKTLASRVGDARASLGVSSADSGSFATYFATVSNATTTALLAFTWLALTSQPGFWTEAIVPRLLNN
jgi:hypothetical protein